MTEQTNSEKWPCWDAHVDVRATFDAIFRGQTLETSGLPIDDAHRRCWEQAVRELAEFRRNWRPGMWLDFPE